ncbi:MAG: hypothetical protein GXO87_09385 [Chlorobi bacterium]|nr:hypothetical protein [Chlorobiota bacterium]
MPLLVNILLSILIIILIALAVYLFGWLKNVKLKIDLAVDDIHRLSKKADPLLEKLTEAVENANRLSAAAETKVSQIVQVIDLIGEKFSWLSKSASSNTSKPNPGESLYIKIRAVSKGMGAFIQRLLK